MRIYKVVDNGIELPIVTDLAELGKLFLKLSKKYPHSDWYWVNEEEI